MTHSQPPDDAATVADAYNWQEIKALNPEAFERLYEINRIYLDYLALQYPRKSRAAIHATPEPGAKQRLRRNPHPAHLSPESRQFLARSPFSLFSARFHDGRFWSTHLRLTAVQDSIPRFLQYHKAHSSAAVFADLALFYAWHLVQSNALAARILLGMSEPTLVAFKQLPLTYIQQLASEQPELVTLRWPERSPFWRRLLHIAQRGCSERLPDMWLLGIQMMASELAESHAIT